MRHRIIPLLTFLAALGATAALAKTITVTVKEAEIRTRASNLSASAGKARYGDRFEAEGPAGAWFKIPGGYLHQSAVTTKKLKLGGDSRVAGGSVTAEELTAAGKGFNADVEREYKRSHDSADFGAVDALEQRSASDEDVRAFARAGGLGGEAR